MFEMRNGGLDVMAGVVFSGNLEHTAGFICRLYVKVNYILSATRSPTSEVE